MVTNSTVWIWDERVPNNIRSTVVDGTVPVRYDMHSCMTLLVALLAFADTDYSTVQVTLLFILCAGLFIITIIIILSLPILRTTPQ